MKQVRLIILFCFMISLIASCSTDLGWRTVKQVDTPWNGPGYQATQIEHGHKYFMPDNPRWDAYWTQQPDGKLRVYDIIDSLEKYFKDNGLLSKWRETGFGHGDTQLRMAPWRICIVSIDPCIAILTPYPDDGESQNNVFHVISVYRKTWLYSTYLVNPIEFGTWIPYAPNFLVIDLDQKEHVPVHVNPSAETTVINLQKCRLALSRRADKFQVDRIK